jgi:hypothetical protein
MNESINESISCTRAPPYCAAFGSTRVRLRSVGGRIDGFNDDFTGYFRLLFGSFRYVFVHLLIVWRTVAHVSARDLCVRAQANKVGCCVSCCQLLCQLLSVVGAFFVSFRRLLSVVVRRAVAHVLACDLCGAQ